MIVAQFEVKQGADVFAFRPLTVRERIGISSDLIDRRRARALATAKDAGMSPKDAAAFVREAVEEAERVSALVMYCFTLEGALAVLRVACTAGSLDKFAESVEPGRLSAVAARCLNVRTDLGDEASDATQGNS